MHVRPLASHCPILSSASLHLKIYALVILDFFYCYIYTSVISYFLVPFFFFFTMFPPTQIVLPMNLCLANSYSSCKNPIQASFSPEVLGWTKKSFSCDPIMISANFYLVYYIEIIYVYMEDLPYFFFMPLVPNTNLMHTLCVFWNKHMIVYNSRWSFFLVYIFTNF